MLAVILATSGMKSTIQCGSSKKDTKGSTKMRLRSLPNINRFEALANKPSSATLIIVPDVLVDHWVEQLTSHSHKNCLGEIFVDNDRRQSLPSVDVLAHMSIVLLTHSRLIKEWQ
jgi:hypothetical protein